MYVIAQHTDFIPTISGSITTVSVPGVCPGPPPPRDDLAYSIDNNLDTIFEPLPSAPSKFSEAFPPAYMCYLVIASIDPNNTANILDYDDEDGVFHVALKITATSVTLETFDGTVSFDTPDIDLADGTFKYIQVCTQGNGLVTLYVNCFERGQAVGFLPRPDNTTSLNDGFLPLGGGTFNVSCPRSCCLYYTDDSAYRVYYSHGNGLVLDLFVGSGTTIGIDQLHRTQGSVSFISQYL